MIATHNTTTIREWVAAAWNRGDFSSAETVYAPDYFIYDPTAPDFAGGPAALCDFIATIRRGLPDLTMYIEQLVEQDDTVAWRWRISGTHGGELFGVPPSGRAVTLSGMVFSRFADGRWAEDWSEWDALGLLRHIGALPAPSDAS